MNIKDGTFDYFLMSFNWCLTLIQTSEVLRIINFILTIISTLLVIIPKLVNWYTNSKKDGKLDSNEIEEGAGILKDSIDELKDVINNKEKRKGKKRK